MLHFVALGYPEYPGEHDVDAYKAFFYGLQHVIPCHTCAVNYARHLKEYPIGPYLSSPDSLFEWTVVMHNAVNRETGKREVTVEEARAALLQTSTVTQPSGHPAVPKLHGVASTFAVIATLVTMAGIVAIVAVGLLRRNRR
jgi:hypothetical protein